MRWSLPLLVLALVPVAGAQDPVAAKDPRNFTWIEEGVLALGGGGLTEDDVDWLKSAGFGAIADLRAEHSDPAEKIAALGMSFFDMPISSASHVNETQLAQFVAWAREQQAAGRPIYLHCTNGWHRAATFAVAWEMAVENESYDHEAAEIMRARPGAVMRAMGALLDYEATLRGQPPLAVAFSSAATRPEPNGTMPVSVEVFARGVPAVGASVRITSEESRLDLTGVTDAMGRFTFTYQAPAKAFMDHLYARATFEGHPDGGDNVEFVFGEPIKERGPVQVSTERTPQGLYVTVTKDGRALPARIIVNGPNWTAVEPSIQGRAMFPSPPEAALDVRAIVWGALPTDAVVAAVGPALPPPTPTPTSPATPSPSPTHGTPGVVTPPLLTPTPVASPTPVAEPQDPGASSSGSIVASGVTLTFEAWQAWIIVLALAGVTAGAAVLRSRMRDEDG